MAHRLSQVVVNLVRSTLAVDQTEWRAVYPCVQHYGRDAVRRAGSSAFCSSWDLLPVDIGVFNFLRRFDTASWATGGHPAHYQTCSILIFKGSIPRHTVQHIVTSKKEAG